MDFVGIVRKSFETVLKHRVLWVLALLASCAGGGGRFSSGFNFPSSTGSGRGGTPTGPTPTTPPSIPEESFQSVLRWMQQNASTMWLIVAGVILLLLVISVIGWIIGVIGRGSLVAGAQQIEDSGNTTFGLAWGTASKRARTLLGMHIVLFGPSFLIALIILGAVAALLITAVVPAIQATRTPTPDAIVAPLLSFLCVIGVLAFVAAIYGIFASIARLFAERAIMLEGLGAIAGIKRGWGVFRKRLGDSIVLGLIMFVIDLVVTLVVGAGIVALLVALAVGGVAAGAFTSFATNPASAFAAMGPGLVLGMLGIGCVLALFSIVVEAFLGAWSSVAWTQAYRRFIA